MAREDENRPDPLTQGKGRIDEVDQSKGFFPPGVPHPEGAEIRMPGSIGGGSYDESGRGGVEVAPGQSASGTSATNTERASGAMGDEAPGGERDEAQESKGALLPHERGQKQ